MPGNAEPLEDESIQMRRRVADLRGFLQRKRPDRTRHGRVGDASLGRARLYGSVGVLRVDQLLLVVALDREAMSEDRQPALETQRLRELQKLGKGIQRRVDVFRLELGFKVPQGGVLAAIRRRKAQPRADDAGERAEIGQSDGRSSTGVLKELEV